MIDIGLWVLVVLFWVWEVIAHFVFHNKDMHTLSNRIWRFEMRYGLKARILIALGVVALFLHLVIHLF